MSDGEAILSIKADTRDASQQMKQLAKQNQQLEQSLARVSKTGASAGRSLTDFGKKISREFDVASARAGNLRDRLGAFDAASAKAYKGQQALSGGLGQTTSSLGSMAGAMKMAAGAGGIGLLVGGLNQAWSAASSLADESMRLTAVFGNVPFSIDGARQATMGLVDDATLAQQALTAQQLGAAQSAQDFDKLAQAGAKLGLALQGDAAKGVADLTLAISRQSPMILDNLGISLKLSEAHEKYAKRLGKTTKDLTDNEKAEAFRVEAINAAITASEDITIKTDGWAAAVQKLNVGLKNTRDTIVGGGVGGGGKTPIEVLREQDEATQRLIADAENHGASLDAVNKILRENGAEMIDGNEASRIAAKLAKERETAELDHAVYMTTAEGKRAKAEKEAAEAEALRLAGVKESIPLLDHELALARARGDDELAMLEIQQERLDAQIEIAKAAGDEAKIRELMLADEVLNAQKLAAIEALSNKRGRGRGGRRKSLIEQLQEETARKNAGLEEGAGGAVEAEIIAADEAEAARFDAYLHREEVRGDMQVAAIEREIEISELRATTEEERMAAAELTFQREQEIYDIRQAQAEERLMFAETESERLAAKDELDQARHEAEILRIEREQDVAAWAEAEEKKRLKTRQKIAATSIDITRNVVNATGQIWTAHAEERKVGEKILFGIQKGIAVADLSLQAIKYGIESTAAFAAQNYFEGASKAAAAAIAGAGAISTAALSPDSARGKVGAGGGGGGGGGGITQPLGNTQSPSDSNIPGSRGGSPVQPGGANGGRSSSGGSTTINIQNVHGSADADFAEKLAVQIKRIENDGRGLGA